MARKTASSDIPPFSEDIIRTLREKPNIKEVHLDVDGTVHLNVFDEMKTVKDKGGKPSKVKTGNKVSGGKKKLIVRTISREDVLKTEATPPPAID